MTLIIVPGSRSRCFYSICVTARVPDTDSKNALVLQTAEKATGWRGALSGLRPKVAVFSIQQVRGTRKSAKSVMIV
jgi:hypothetical protein